MRGRCFVKGDPRINRKGTSNPGNSGRPSEIHRAQCRKLFEENKFREFLCSAANGENVDMTITMGGKIVKIPTHFGNKLKAIAWLGEQGYGKAPQEIQHAISPETLEKFERQLLSIFNAHIPKMCPHCRTALKLSPDLAKEIMELSQIFEKEEVRVTVPAEETV